MAYKATSMTRAGFWRLGKSRRIAHSSSTQTISTLARQLADSASRAAERDENSPVQTRATKAKSSESNIRGFLHQANKKKHDREIPNTNDPELLAEPEAGDRIC